MVSPWMGDHLRRPGAAGINLKEKKKLPNKNQITQPRMTQDVTVNCVPN